jgi:hypothetical protein
MNRIDAVVDACHDRFSNRFFVGESESTFPLSSRSMRWTRRLVGEGARKDLVPMSGVVVLKGGKEKTADGVPRVSCRDYCSILPNINRLITRSPSP